MQPTARPLEHDEQIKVGLGKWHTLPADQPLQQRVHRIGMALVPAYQRDLPGDDYIQDSLPLFRCRQQKAARGGLPARWRRPRVAKQTVEAAQH